MWAPDGLQEAQHCAKEAAAQQQRYEQSVDVLTGLQARMHQTQQLVSTCSSAAGNTAGTAPHLEQQLKSARWAAFYYQQGSKLSVCASVCHCVCVSVCLSVCLSVCVSACHPVCLPVCLLALLSDQMLQGSSQTQMATGVMTQCHNVVVICCTVTS